MPLHFKSDLIAEVPQVLRTSFPVTFKWLLFPQHWKAKPVRDSAGFHKRLALVLQVLLRISGGNMVPDVWSLGVINPGTHKEAFTAGCTTGPQLMPAPVGRLGSCSRCFPLACLHASNARESKACYTYCIHVEYTMLQCAPWRKCSLVSQRTVLVKGLGALSHFLE